MKSSQKNSVAHLETIRRRRMRRIRRQRAIEVGKPVDVSLKPMTLNPCPAEGNFQPPTSTVCRPEAWTHDTEARVSNCCFRTSLNRRAACGTLYRLAHPP